jgi:TolB-like protein/DNA-binding winged helix-turn-helix (wHTH) protein/Flp pilus assembly protein TadD
MIFKLGEVELNTELFSITREGQPISVEPKVFDMLVFLIRHRDRLVTRDQLFDELWPDSVVSDNVLSNQIKLARAVLGDDGNQQKYIRTVRGRGYQFVGEVQEIDSTIIPAAAAANDAPSPEPAAEVPAKGAPAPGSVLLNPRSLMFVAAVLVAGVFAFIWLKDSRERANETATAASSDTSVEAPVNLRPKTIAILPFDNRSNLEEDAYFVDGFHDDLISQVSQIRDLSTISRTSVLTYRDSNKSMRTIGNELGSGIIIEGGVQRSGEQVRINVQMIDAAKDEHLWAETYTRTLSAENLFTIQSEIAFAVAGNLLAVMSNQEKQDIAKVRTQNIKALEAFFRGRVSAGLETTAGFIEATEHFQEAVNLDPNFAEAHAQLALALLYKASFSTAPYVMPGNEDAETAESAIQRALDLNPELSEAYEALAALEHNRRNFPAAEEAYQQALKLKPGNASALRMYGNFKATRLWQRQQGLTLLHAAKRLDPQNHRTLTNIGEVLKNLERFEEAHASLLAAIDIEPDHARAYFELGWLYHTKLYQHDQAIKAFRRFRFLDPDTPWNLLELATAYDDLGIADQATYLYERHLDLNQDDLYSHIARARLHLLRGESEQAERVFEKMKALYAGLNSEVDAMLTGFDLHQGNPGLVIERIETAYPILMSPDSYNGHDPHVFKMALIYAAALYQTGQEERAAPLIRRIFEILPSWSRHRWEGFQTLDTWLHMAMGNEDAAIQSIREWRAIGGRVDLTQHRMVPDSLFDHPEFQAINNEILAELAEQRANLARMEAAGEVAPMPQ